MLVQSEDASLKGKPKGSVVPFRESLIFENVPRGPARTSQPELGVWLLAIPNGSKQLKRALEFVGYATDLGDDAGANQLKQSFAATKFATPPPRKLVLDGLEKDGEFAAKHASLIPAIRWSLENARARPRTACWREIECRLGTALEQMIEQGVSSNDGIKRITKEIDPLFDESGCNRFLQHKDTNYSCASDSF